MCSGPEAGSYLRLTDFVYHSTLGLRVIKKKKTNTNVDDPAGFRRGRVWRRSTLPRASQGYLAHKKQPPPTHRLPQGPRHRPTVGS